MVRILVLLVLLDVIAVCTVAVAAYNMGRADAERSVICEKPGT